MSRTIPLDRYRNIGILASLDAGRTTTTERLLAVSAREATIGTGTLGTGLGGWIAQDNERDITLTSAATSCVWRECRVNIVELPSLFRQPASGPLNVLDGTIIIIDAVSGLTADVDAALDAAELRGIARLVFINKLDREDADPAAVLAALAARGRAIPLPLQLPIGAGAGLQGLVDVVENEAIFWRDAGHDVPGERGAVPEALQAEVSAVRAKIVAAIGASQGDTNLGPRLRSAVRAGTVLPVLFGSAFRNRGIRSLLDAVVDYLPAPSEVDLHAVAADGQAVERRGADDEPFSGLAFQTVDDPAVGQLTFVRIYSGVVATGTLMLNSVSASPERIGGMVRMFANHTEEIDEARAGDIVALSGLKHTTTGDTLCDPAAPVILERVPASAGRAKH